jgi:hypothetical protein
MVASDSLRSLGALADPLSKNTQVHDNTERGEKGRRIAS